MSAAIYNGGLIDWSAERDETGYRTYTLDMLVYSDFTDGPYEVMNAAGLPAIGSSWSFGGDNDPWSFCRPNIKVARYEAKGGEKWRWWKVTQTFSNKPLQRCQDTSIDNPLEEPPKLSGSFVRYQKPAEKDKNGKLILSSSHEKITGLEKEANRPQVVIEFNDSTLDLATFSQFVNGINDAPLWGVPTYGVMLTDCSWERKLYGVCSFYFTKRFTFDIKYERWIENDIADRGFRKYIGIDVFGGGKDNPDNFELIKDVKDDKHITPTMLKLGDVNPDPVNDPQFIPTVQFYNAYNLLTLGIPSSLE